MHIKAAVQAVLSEGKQVKETNLNPLCVFVMPPSMEELERRLRDRGTESEESLQKRLNTAKSEIEYVVAILFQTYFKSFSVSNLFFLFIFFYYRMGIESSSEEEDDGEGQEE
ncbi:hypothetical protein C0J52_07864 [Blattella germanica]|nr:hypothetical protein C0J52_07864 [Blattella germanica]